MRRSTTFYQNHLYEEPVGRITQIIHARMGTTKHSMSPTASNSNVQTDATTNKREDTSKKEEKWWNTLMFMFIQLNYYQLVLFMAITL